MKEHEFDRDMWGIPIPRPGTLCTVKGCKEQAVDFYCVPCTEIMEPRCQEHLDVSPIESHTWEEMEADGE